ncbi:MAG: T9SS type A sorting domain-containing protein [Ignavibacteriaceae bacterium]|nr:T9SS type A sorting domain-containing protein [Ignavibacteriaceae bacterium]
MRTLKISLLVFILSITISAQWYEISSNLPSDWFTNSIDAIDSMNAVGPLQGYNSFFITENGGQNWTEQYRPSYCEVISMVTKDKIWFTNFDAAEIWATKDGGNTWKLQFYDPALTQFMNYIEMFDSLNGVAMGDAPAYDKPALFLRTTDGGENWISMNPDELIGLLSGDLWRRVDFININVGYFYSTGEITQKLYKTTNGGNDWTVIADTFASRTIKFYDENLGIIYGAHLVDSVCVPQMYRTKDGGQNWEYITTVSTDYCMDIEFIPNRPSDVWLIAGNRAFFSSDSGSIWTAELYIQELDYYYGFRDIVFTDENNGWLLGRTPNPVSNRIYRTTNGGFGGLVEINEDYNKNLPAEFSLSQNYPNPFNPITKIKYSIPQSPLLGEDGRGGLVTLKVYDILGREIATLVNEEKPAREFEVEFNAANLPSGIYFYQIKAGNFVETKKMVLLR